MALFEKPWRESLIDLFDRLVRPGAKWITLSPSDKGWLNAVWPRLSPHLVKPAPIPQRGTTRLYGQIQRAQKLRRRRRDGPKYRRKRAENP